MNHNADEVLLKTASWTGTQKNEKDPSMQTDKM